VSLYRHELDKLNGAISLLDEETGIKILYGHYDKNTGVVLEDNPEDYIA